MTIAARIVPALARGGAHVRALEVARARASIRAVPPPLAASRLCADGGGYCLACDARAGEPCRQPALKR